MRRDSFRVKVRLEKIQLVGGNRTLSKVEQRKEQIYAFNAPSEQYGDYPKKWEYLQL